MAKRLFDIVAALVTLGLSAPLILFGMAGIALSSPGPLFYRARRVGRDGRVFLMLKLRSMHVSEGGAAITSAGDKRVFPFGNLVRKLKIDELPQFLNVLNGDMAIVGPRPEDPGIVSRHYAGWMHETLAVRPGVTSPGAIFYYACGEDLIDADDPEGSYANRILAPKLAIERAYLDRATLWSDLSVMLRTIAAVAGHILGVPVAPPRRDRQSAEIWCPASAFPDAS